MKNLLIYINPSKKFGREIDLLARLQIHNSLDMGWNIKDIVLVTNFPYEYKGVKSIVIGGDSFYAASPGSTKTPTISYLLKNNMLENDLYWAHDFDAYQNNVIEESEIDLEGFDMGLCTYEYKKDWNCGSIFFKLSAEDLFTIVTKVMYRRARSRAEEKTFYKLTNNGYIDKNRIKKMNVTYNINMRDIGYTATIASKPLKVLHFHPYSVDDDSKIPNTMLNTFMYGKNKFKRPLMSERLIKLFHSYGIK